MTLEDCLPAELRAGPVTITKIAAGLSGAGVYRVEAADRTLVLKVSPESEPVADWRRRVHVQRLAAAAGLTPAVVHADEAHRAVLTAFVADRSFVGLYADPRTRDAAVAQLGRTIRRLHDLPLPPGAPASDPRAFVTGVWSALSDGWPVPGFARDALERVLAEAPPADGRADVLGHNDLNPTNLVYDGEAILLLDWQTAGPMHPLYDPAVVAVFLRMDEATCLALLSACEGVPVEGLPPRFSYFRRLAAAACGAVFLRLARQLGHAGAAGDETLAAAPSLGDLYARMRTGGLDVATAGGQWSFGLALLKESLAL